MKSIYQILLYGIISCLLLTSCEEEDKRTVFPHSTPVIESASISPNMFTYGDSVTITAKVSDPITPLSTLEMKMIVNDVLIAEETIRTQGNSTEVSKKFKVAYTRELPDDANVEILLTLINVEGDETKGTISGVKGKRKYYNTLYLVLDNGDVIPLSPQSSNPDHYSAGETVIKSNSIRYRIAEKITSDNQIDFSGDVWGYKGNTIQLVDENGDYITTNTTSDYITDITFDAYEFSTNLSGGSYNPNDLVLDNFNDVTANNEAFKKLSRSFEKNQEVNLFGDLASSDIVYNLDFFQRVSEDKVKFIGETGTYDLYYSPTRQFVLVEPSNREYPNILLACGVGLGYPSKVEADAHTAWDFNAPLQAIVFHKTAADTYQATVYLDAADANFKFFENSGWANEKKSDDFTLPDILMNSQQNHDLNGGNVDGNWYAAVGTASGNYKITINLATKVVIAESIVLP